MEFVKNHDGRSEPDLDDVKIDLMGVANSKKKLRAFVESLHEGPLRTLWLILLHYQEDGRQGVLKSIVKDCREYHGDCHDQWGYLIEYMKFCLEESRAI